MTLADTACQKKQSTILTSGLCSVASFVQEHSIEGEVMLHKLVVEATHSHEWDMSLSTQEICAHSIMQIR